MKESIQYNPNKVFSSRIKQPDFPTNTKIRNMRLSKCFKLRQVRQRCSDISSNRCYVGQWTFEHGGGSRFSAAVVSTHHDLIINTVREQLCRQECTTQLSTDAQSTRSRPTPDSDESKSRVKPAPMREEQRRLPPSMKHRPQKLRHEPVSITKNS